MWFPKWGRRASFGESGFGESPPTVIESLTSMFIGEIALYLALHLLEVCYGVIQKFRWRKRNEENDVAVRGRCVRAVDGRFRVRRREGRRPRAPAEKAPAVEKAAPAADKLPPRRRAEGREGREEGQEAEEGEKKAEPKEEAPAATPATPAPRGAREVTSFSKNRGPAPQGFRDSGQGDTIPLPFFFPCGFLSADARRFAARHLTFRRASANNLDLLKNIVTITPRRGCA